MKPTHWKCYRCKVIKEAKYFPKHLDQKTLCTACQQGHSTAPLMDAAEGTPQQAIVRRRFNARHGKDNRTTD